MKVIDSSVGIIVQNPGIEGMKRHIEKCARICYRSEGNITKDSYVKFLGMLYSRGHWNALSLGTVYMKIPVSDSEVIEKLCKTGPFTRWNTFKNYIKLTTNYRIICQLGLEAEMEKYWVEPDDDFYKRVTADFICSRSTSHQLVRHRAFCMLQESQRYCNYSKDNKFKDGLIFILPSWAYRLRDMLGVTFNKYTGESREGLLNTSGENLWNKLKEENHPLVQARSRYWETCEAEYNYEVTGKFGDLKINPEDARGVLCNDVKTELCLCGYIEDWMYEPSEDSKEKAGFFYLRTAKDAQEDIRLLALSLKEQFEIRGYDKMR